MTSGQAYLLLCAFAAALVMMMIDPMIDEIGASIERSSRFIQDASR